LGCRDLAGVVLEGSFEQTVRKDQAPGVDHPGERDPELSHRSREAILTAVTVEPRKRAGGRRPTPASHAIALKAALPELDASLSDAERGLLAEWLDRIGRSRA
jgi:hypothetical protein